MEQKFTQQQKMKLIVKLIENGCHTEKDILSLDLEKIVKIKNITIPELVLTTQLQKNIKDNKLFSFLAGESSLESQFK